jgi:hypothetical protein
MMYLMTGVPVLMTGVPVNGRHSWIFFRETIG